MISIDKKNSAESTSNKSPGTKSTGNISAGNKSASGRSAGGALARVAVLIGAPVFAVIGFIYIFTFNPVSQKSFFLPCPINQTTGLYCPGCGNTRALHALVHLDFLGMLNYNLIFLVTFFILTWLLTGEYLNLLLGRRVLWLPKRVSPILIILAGIAVAAFTILRNVPIYPFSMLAP